MHSIEAMYLLANTISVIAMAPQIRQLLSTKQSEEFSLPTWSIWLCTQTVALVYSIAIGSLPYAIVSVSWISFYIVMLTMIVRYRKNSPQLALQESNEEATAEGA